MAGQISGGWQGMETRQALDDRPGFRDGQRLGTWVVAKEEYVGDSHVATRSSRTEVMETKRLDCPWIFNQRHRKERVVGHSGMLGGFRLGGQGGRQAVLGSGRNSRIILKRLHALTLGLK